MSCCGNKRSQWKQTSGPSLSANPVAAIEAEPLKSRSSKVFEYIGSFSLSLKGSITGQTYFFSGPGERVAIAYEDSFSLMAERDLKSVRASA
jgi:hypothetical protein